MNARQPSHYAAFFWGMVVFMPVGMNYLGLFVLVVCVSLQGGRRQRLSRLRAHAVWWPTIFFLGWITLVLLIGARYPETPSNLWHSLRILITVWVVMSLTRDEAVWGLRGFVSAVLLNLAFIVLDQIFGLPEWPVWANSIELNGNKSIANAVMFTLVAVCILVWTAERTWQYKLPGGLVASALLTIPIAVLPSRTSLVVAAFSIACLVVHRWRGHPRLLVAATASIVLAVSLVVSSIPKVHERFALGISEVQRASAGVVALDSWGVRFNMYRHTTEMMLERPVAGWGIGSWNEQWRLRAPPVLAGFNMPHNDFLWMGAQAGVPGAFALIWIFVAGMRGPWRRQDVTGRMALAAVLTLLLTTAFNSGMRDAAMGLCLIWVTGLCLRMASEPVDAVDALLGRVAATIPMAQDRGTNAG